MNLEKSTLSKLVLRLRSQIQTEPQDSNTIRPNQIMRKQKITTWHIGKNKKKKSKLECCLALNREYTVADYLTIVDWPKRKESFDYVQTQWA